MPDNAFTTAITAAEAARLKALVAQDFDTLASLLHEDLVHIHASSVVETKAQFLATARGRLQFLKVERRSYELRLAGTAVIAVGELDQRVKVRATGEEIDLDMVTSQVWVSTSGGWQQLHYHATMRKR
jgi:hypothetical protein